MSAGDARLRLLFAASEARPFAKTGGLGDVSRALPDALLQHGADVRLLVPAYRGSLEQLVDARPLVTLNVKGQDFRIWEGGVAGSALRVWLADCPALYARPGTPYSDAAGVEHADNAWRFGCFGALIAQLALDGIDGWTPEVLHLNDWQTGLAPVWLQGAARRPRVVFTIHNLAYAGLFACSELDALGVPAKFWSPDALEFWGRASFIKGGIVFADAVTTVSPNYAREIQTPEFGHGLDGLLRHRAAQLHGILNGIDDALWDPARDAYLHARYDAATVEAGKRANRSALRAELGLDAGERDGPALIGIVSRLAHQKGLDLVLAAAAELQALPVQLVVLGAGEPELEQQLRAWAKREPQRVAVHIGYDERLAHRIEAGSDLFLMPSRYEPCGLNQMYSQRYGTIPLVRRCGGLVDSVVDASPANLAAGTATGVFFDEASPDALLGAVRVALNLRGSAHWRAMQRAGMATDFSWARAAARYMDLYCAPA